MLKLTENLLFVTSCFTTYVNDIDRDKIILSVKDLQKNIPSTQKSNEGGWQSPVIQRTEYDNIETSNLFEKFIIPAAKEISKIWSLPSTMENVGYWYNINYKYSSNREHTHPGAFLSGVYYLRVPSNSGNIVFLRSNSEHDKMEFIHNKIQESGLQIDNNRINTEHWFGPEQGLLILFPGHLTHYVKQNLTNDSDDRRISLSFNFW